MRGRRADRGGEVGALKRPCLSSCQLSVFQVHCLLSSRRRPAFTTVCIASTCSTDIGVRTATMGVLSFCHWKYRISVEE